MKPKIDKNVPVPKGWNRHNGVGYTELLRNLEVGESFFAAGASSNSLTMRSYMKPKKFALRSLEEKGVKGVRVWRVE